MNTLAALRSLIRLWIPTVVLSLALLAIGCASQNAGSQNTTTAKAATSGSDGRDIFRFDTFGDEQLWTDTLQMQKALRTVSPRTALSVGLKVDSDALPPELIDAIKKGQINLDDPAVTMQLLKLNAVVGVVGKVVGANNNLAKVGITCALCHSTVDNSVAHGIGKRLDGWANRSLNVGAIIALSPALTDKSPFNSWGPGKFDPRFQAFNGTTFVPLNSPSLPVVIPSIFGLQGVRRFETFTADGPISYWNNYVGVTQMGGHGSFSDSRIGVAVTQTPDLVTPKLPALLQYQLSLQTPAPPAGSFNRAAAKRGEKLFNDTAGCAKCHTPPLFTDVLSGPDPRVPLLHSPAEVGTEPVYASRSATKTGYRTTPLLALWQHPPYFHDGSAPSLATVVEHYNSQFSLGLTAKQKADLVEYLKSL
jgi:cytochrome c2